MTVTGMTAPQQDVFPHERVVFFSDAVFAIAITLLAIELKAPSEALVAAVGVGNAWVRLLPLLIAYVVSFLVTAQFWTGHMLSWKHVRTTTPKLVTLTVFQLMFVALMPFATAMYSESFTPQNFHEHMAFVIYCLVLTGISFFAWLTRREVVRAEGLGQSMPPVEARWFVVRSVVPLVVFASCIPLAFLLPPWAGSILFSLIGPVSALCRRRVFGRAGHDAAPAAGA